MSEEKVPWPHAPTHQLARGGTFFVSAGTYHKLHHFKGSHRLEVLHRGLLKVACKFEWRLEAWSVFSNHYHFVGHSPRNQDTAQSLSFMLGELHKKTAHWINRLDKTPERQCWHNFRETRLTHQTSLMARLKYVHHNAVKHGLVRVANQYPWCSARWFERTAAPAQIKSIYRFKIDRVNVLDEFEPDPDW